MPTVNQIAEWASNEVHKGKGDLHTNEVVIIEDLIHERVKRPASKKSKVCFQTDPETYDLWLEVRDRWVTLCGHYPVIAFRLMCKVLSLVKDETIRALAEEGQ